MTENIVQKILDYFEEIKTHNYSRYIIETDLQNIINSWDQSSYWQGYAEGKSEGLEEGYSNGYDEGYDDGLADVSADGSDN